MPAIVRVPVLLADDVFAATEKVTVPLPAPLAPAVTVIQETLLTPVHAHPVPAVTVTVPVAPAAAADIDVGVIVGAHGAVNENVFESELADAPPGPTAETRDS